MFSCQISANACANGIDSDAGTVEAVLFKDVDVRLDLGVVRSVFSSWIVGNGVNKITYVNYRCKCWLPRHGEEDVGRIYGKL